MPLDEGKKISSDVIMTSEIPGFFWQLEEYYDWVMCMYTKTLLTWPLVILRNVPGYLFSCPWKWWA